MSPDVTSSSSSWNCCFLWWKPTGSTGCWYLHITEIMSLGSVSRLGTDECLDLHVQVWRARNQGTHYLHRSYHKFYLLIPSIFASVNRISYMILWYKTRNEVCRLYRYIQHRSYVWGPSVSSGYSCFSPHGLAGLFFWTWSWPLVRAGHGREIEEANPSGSLKEKRSIDICKMSATDYIINWNYIYRTCCFFEQRNKYIYIYTYIYMDMQQILKDRQPTGSWQLQYQGNFLPYCFPLC